MKITYVAMYDSHIHRFALYCFEGSVKPCTYERDIEGNLECPLLGVPLHVRMHNMCVPLLCRHHVRGSLFSRPLYNHVMKSEECLAEPASIVKLSIKTLKVEELEVSALAVV